MRMPWRRHRVGTPDPEGFLSELARSYPGKAYRPMDRYRDFRRVFLDSEQGRRVLYEILSWSGMFRSSAVQAKFETNETFFHDGEENIGLKLMATMHAEPKERPGRPG